MEQAEIIDTFWTYHRAQAASEEKRQVFENLLESYSASLRLLASAQLQVNQQTAKVAELKGNPVDPQLIDFIFWF